MSTFDQLNLHTSINKAIHACGYTKPTSVQSRAIPEILKRRDLVASAQTGTGKTAAFVLPALHQLANSGLQPKPRILILTPTRELATQITAATALYGKFLKFSLASLVGGMSYKQQLRALARPVDIIVATPGRLMDHMQNRRIDLSQIEMLVLDEADRMLDMGFIDDVKYIAKATPANRQTLLFSATFDKRISEVVNQLLKNPVRIDLSNEKITPTQITQELYMANSPQHKMQLLNHFLQNENIFKAIIFSATKINADRLASELQEQGFEAAALHGDLKQGVRNKTLEQLRRGKIQYLVATDVAARGLDVSDITHVINFDLPKFSEDYVHRIGRTGRAGKEGVAISFALRQDNRHIQKIERFIGQKLPLCTVPGLEPSFKPGQDGGHKKKSFGGGGKPRFGKGKESSRGDKPRFNKDKANFRGDKPRFSKDREDFRGDKPRFSKDKENFRGDKPRFGKDKEDFRGDRPRFSKDRENFRGDKYPFGKDQHNFRGEKSDFRKDKKDFRGDKHSFGRDKNDFRGEKSDFRKDKKDFRGDKRSFGKDKNDFRSKKSDFRKDKKDFRGDKHPFGKDKSDFRSEKSNSRKDKKDFRGDKRHFGKDKNDFRNGKPRENYGNPNFKKRKKDFWD